ncbi:MAG: protein kinase, partial [Polyangiaceae bacterium]|nr:protein kinase [Polyangiaceae bacterium]
MTENSGEQEMATPAPSSIPPSLEGYGTGLGGASPSEPPPSLESLLQSTVEEQPITKEDSVPPSRGVPLAPQKLPSIEPPHAETSPKESAPDTSRSEHSESRLNTKASAPPSSPDDSVDSPDTALDSHPPSIPSAAAIEGTGSYSSALSQVGSQALPDDIIAGRYRVINVLGEGGMGIVYRCEDLGTNEIIALKRVVVPDRDHTEEYLMWFYKEARALAALDHPSIVGAIDFGRLRDGSPYLVMDLAEGRSLHDLTHAGLQWPAIWHIVDQILGGLAHAHSRGIIHGDLKPSNVLVQEVDGQPPLIHLLDYGLAWLKADTHDERLDGEKAPEFKPHAGAGTPGYMAPEQIQHEQHHVVGATDLYALG